MKQITEKDIKLLSRDKNSHKGQNGIVLVIGGSKEYVGAPYFAGMSSMKAGVDLCYLAVPDSVGWMISSKSPDLITLKVQGDYLNMRHFKDITQLSEKADVIVLGNGIGQKHETRCLVKRLLAYFVSKQKKVILDADALKLISLKDCKEVILTPHEGEYKTLLQNSKLKELSSEEMQSLIGNNILVAKGHPETKIISKDSIVVSKTGNPGMTKGGCGDVLAGMIAGLIAQGNDPFDSACFGVFLNGKSADMLYKEKGFGFLASDLMNNIPEMLKKYQKIR